MTRGSRAYVLRALREWAQATKQGLGLVTYRSSTIRQEIIEDLSNALSPAGWTSQNIQATGLDANGLLAAIRNSTAEIIHVLDSEDLLFAPENQPQRFWINFQREAVTDQPAIQIWWFTPTGATSLAQDLPDLNRFFLFREDLAEQDAPLPTNDVPASRIAKEAPVAQLFLSRTSRAIAAQAPAHQIWQELALPAIDELLKANRPQEAWDHFQSILQQIDPPKTHSLTPNSLRILGQLQLEAANPLSPSAQIQAAIEYYQSALTRCGETEDPMLWARLQFLLGNAFRQLRSGSRAANLQRAIDYYQNSLRTFTEAQFPQEWASTQNNLGNACLQLSTSDGPNDNRSANLLTAISHYQAALRVRTEGQFPQSWASTQNNLGTAYAQLPVGDHAANLLSAIDCYQSALRAYSEAKFPHAWARTQNNLGAAYSQLPNSTSQSENRAGNLLNAISHYQAALSVLTESQFPQEWAGTQNNLGHAYAQLPTGDRATNLLTAVSHYQNALRIWTPTAFPHDFELANHNLNAAQTALDALFHTSADPNDSTPTT